MQTLVTEAECFACHRFFCFNPDLVPMVEMGKDSFPICESCTRVANKLRAKAKLPQIKIRPNTYYHV